MMAFLDWLFQPDTVRWEVTTSALGVAVVAVLSYVLSRAYRLWADRTSIEGRFCDSDIETAIHSRRFERWPTTLRVLEGNRRVIFGIMARDADLNITQINVRPVERRRFWRWQNQPNISLDGPHPSWAIYLKPIACRQIEHERRGATAGALFNVWHDSKAGFDCYLPLGNSFSLEKGTVIWFEIEVEAKRDWKGALGVRANILHGPKLLCRRQIEIVGDHDQLNG